MVDLVACLRELYYTAMVMATSLNLHIPFAHCICAGVWQSASKRFGEATRMNAHLALLDATFNLFGAKMKDIPRGASSTVELAME